MDKQSRILIVGHDDVIERSLYGFFLRQGFRNLYSSAQSYLDVLSRESVRRFFSSKKPEYVFLTSVRSGGIEANQKHAAEFIYENLQAQNNIIDVSYRSGVTKLLYLSSSCVYPKESPQPIREEYLL